MLKRKISKGLWREDKYKVVMGIKRDYKVGVVEIW
jgi:hypothetical protein